MALNHSALKRPSSNQIQELAKKLEAANKVPGAGDRQKDDRFWHPEIDSAGNGSAVIRFLPPKSDDSYPFVKIYDHGFQENNAWYIETCPTTKGQGHPCPACEHNSQMWNSGIESDKEIARKHKRRLKYYSNVLIIKDPAHPENEGQVKIFRYGVKIFEMIQACFNNDADMGEEAFNPFGFFDGANFGMKIITVGGFINYDKSKFIKAPDLYNGDEDKLIEVLEKMADLQEFVADDKFKSYEELAARFNQVVFGVKGKGGVSIKQEAEDEFAPAPQKAAKEHSPKEEPAKPASSDEDDDLKFFQDLLNK
jgi:hypothetical protein